MGFVGMMKYIVSLLLYSSFKRKLIILIHMYVAYKMGQYLLNDEALRHFRHTVGGNGSVQLIHDIWMTVSSYMHAMARVTTVLLRSTLALVMELLLFVPRVLAKLLVDPSTLEDTQPVTIPPSTTTTSSAGAISAPAGAAHTDGGEDYRRRELERLEKLERAKQRATTDQATRELERTRRTQLEAVGRLQREKAEHEARLLRARQKLEQETQALVVAKRQASAFEAQAAQMTAARTNVASNRASSQQAAPADEAGWKREADISVREKALQEERQRIETARVREDEVKNKQRVLALEETKTRLESEVQELINEQKQLTAAAETAEKKKVTEERLAEEAYKRRLEEAAKQSEDAQRQRRAELDRLEAESRSKREEEGRRLRELTQAAQQEEQKGLLALKKAQELQARLVQLAVQKDQEARRLFEATNHRKHEEGQVAALTKQRQQEQEELKRLAAVRT